MAKTWNPRKIAHQMQLNAAIKAISEAMTVAVAETLLVDFDFTKEDVDDFMVKLSPRVDKIAKEMV